MKNIDIDKIDETMLALLYLTMWEDKYGGVYTWKGYDWAAMERLHEKGYIADPKSKNKSVLVTAEGAKKAKELFEKMFAES